MHLQEQERKQSPCICCAVALDVSRMSNSKELIAGSQEGLWIPSDTRKDAQGIPVVPPKIAIAVVETSTLNVMCCMR